MNQKKAAALILVVFIAIMGGLYLLYRTYTGNDTEGPQGNAGGPSGTSPIFGSGPLGDNDKKPAVQDPNAPAPKLRQVSATPVAGAVLFGGSTTTIRYVERETGHLYETRATSLTVTRISNTTVPRVQEALWSADGTSVLLRYLADNDIVKTFYGALSKSKLSLDGWFLENNIEALAGNPDGSLFYIARTNETASGIIASADGTGGREIFSSPIRDWNAYWSGDLFLATKPSYGIPGYLYTIDTTTGALLKLLEGRGLIVLPSPNGTHVLYSTSGAAGTALYVYSRTSGDLLTIPFRTLADKCAWASETRIYCASPFMAERGEYPDDWYQGLVSFSDDVWQFDLAANAESLIYDAEADGRNFDMINLHAAENTLLFMDKKDLSLWSLSL